MRVTLTVPDADKAFLAQLVAERGYTMVEETARFDELEVPEWQKEITRQRRAEAKPEDYKPWSEVRKRWGL